MIKSGRGGVINGQSGLRNLLATFEVIFSFFWELGRGLSGGELIPASVNRAEYV